MIRQSAHAYKIRVHLADGLVETLGPYWALIFGFTWVLEVPRRIQRSVPNCEIAAENRLNAGWARTESNCQQTD